MFKIVILLVLITIFIIPSYTFDIELTIVVPPNKQECLHQVLEHGIVVETEYEVLSSGDPDMNYWFYSPSSRVLLSNFKKRDNREQFRIDEAGEYRFCFDSLSHFHSKQVYFSLRRINPNGQNEVVDNIEPWMKNIVRDDLGDLQDKMQEFKVRFITECIL